MSLLSAWMGQAIFYQLDLLGGQLESKTVQSPSLPVLLKHDALCSRRGNISEESGPRTGPWTRTCRARASSALRDGRWMRANCGLYEGSSLPFPRRKCRALECTAVFTYLLFPRPCYPPTTDLQKELLKAFVQKRNRRRSSRSPVQGTTQVREKHHLTLKRQKDR